MAKICVSFIQICRECNFVTSYSHNLGKAFQLSPVLSALGSAPFPRGIFQGDLNRSCLSLSMEDILSQWTSLKIQVPRHSNEACKLHHFIVWLSFQLCYPVEVCLQATTSPDYLMSKWQSCKTMVTFTCSIVVVTGWIRLWIVLQICIQNEMSERCKYEWWLVNGNPHVFSIPPSNTT